MVVFFSEVLPKFVRERPIDNVFAFNYGPKTHCEIGSRYERPLLLT